jgi:hypothetical protein
VAIRVIQCRADLVNHADSGSTVRPILNWVRFVDGTHFFARERREDVRLMGY